MVIVSTNIQKIVGQIPAESQNFIVVYYIGFEWEYAATPTKGLSYHQGHRVV